MRILLTTPPQSTYSILPDKYKPLHKILRWIGGNKSILGIQPPYGLMYISSYLKKDNHQVFVVDGLLSSQEYIMKKIADENIDIVGLSTVSWNWNEAKKFSELLKNTFPLLKLAVGGAHVNSERARVLEECMYFDYAFYGDSEETFSTLVNMLSSGKKIEPMDGFAYRDKERISASEKTCVIKDIDSILFPDRETLTITNYRPAPLSYRKLPFTAMFGSRGCPYQCTFCHTDKLVRIRSAQNLILEIELLQKKYGIREILFFDDTFTLDKKRVFDFCSLLLRKKIDLSWCVSVRADSIDPQMLRAMKKAGCWRLLIGIETGSQRLLDRIHKKIKLQQIEYAVKIIKDADIQTYGMFMFGIPTETYEEGLETIRFMKKLKLDYINVTNLTPFPGTEIYKEVVNEVGFKGYDYMNMFDIAYVPSSMTENQLQDLLKRSLREFYLRFSYILRQISNIRSFSDIIRYIRGTIIVLLR